MNAKMKWTASSANSDLDFATARAVGSSSQVMAIEAHGSEVHGQHSVEERLPEISQNLDRFHGGHAADRSGHGAEDRKLAAPFAGFFRNQASQAWSSPWHQ